MLRRKQCLKKFRFIATDSIHCLQCARVLTGLSSSDSSLPGGDGGTGAEDFKLRSTARGHQGRGEQISQRGGERHKSLG